MVIDKTIFVHTKCHVSLKTLELNGSRHTPGGAYATPPLGRIADRPMFIVTRVQSYDVCRCLGWSLCFLNDCIFSTSVSAHSSRILSTSKFNSVLLAASISILPSLSVLSEAIPTLISAVFTFSSVLLYLPGWDCLLSGVLT